MGYGLTFDDVKNINSPAAITKPWGNIVSCTQSLHYSMHRLEIAPQSAQQLHFHPHGSGHLFVESGDLFLRTLDQEGRERTRTISQGTWFAIPPHLVYALSSVAGAVAYLAGPRVENMLESVIVEHQDQALAALLRDAKLTQQPSGMVTTNVLEKYWGRIESFSDGDVAAKRIFVRRGGQSSMEFHVYKRETYWIHSGLIKIGLRVGRAENHSIILKPGDGYDIQPGYMHMRIALEDTVIIEVSTRDSDSDSYLVEDGQTYQFVETHASN